MWTLFGRELLPVCYPRARRECAPGHLTLGQNVWVADHPGLFQVRVGELPLGAIPDHYGIRDLLGKPLAPE